MTIISTPPSVSFAGSQTPEPKKSRIVTLKLNQTRANTRFLRNLDKTDSVARNTSENATKKPGYRGWVDDNRDDEAKLARNHDAFVNSYTLLDELSGRKRK